MSGIGESRVCDRCVGGVVGVFVEGKGDMAMLR